MNSAQDILQILENCGRFLEFLEADNESGREVGCILTASGEVRQLKEGDMQEIGFYGAGTGHEPVAVVHTHPTIDSGPTLSESDFEIRTQNRGIQGMVVLSREMFETTWDGVCLYLGPSTDIDAEYEEIRFRVVCDGTTAGPAEEKHVKNPRIEFDI